MNTNNINTNTDNDPGLYFAESMKQRYDNALSNAPKVAKLLGDNARFDFATLSEAQEYLCWQFVSRIKRREERSNGGAGKWEFSLDTLILSYFYRGICYVEINVVGERNCHLGNNFWVARDGGLNTVKRFGKEFGWEPSFKSWPLR